MCSQQGGHGSSFLAWAPILPQYGPDFLVTCENASELTRRLVLQWLRDYMLAHIKPKAARAKKVRRLSDFLTDHNRHSTHGRHLDRDVLQRYGMQVEIPEADPIQQDLVLSVYHATALTFTIIPAVAKLIENHHGRLFGKAVAVMTAVPQPAAAAPAST
jgi:hypothetical protein